MKSNKKTPLRIEDFKKKASASSKKQKPNKVVGGSGHIDNSSEYTQIGG